MAWYDEAVFYHIYPLGLLGAPKQNDYVIGEHRLKKLDVWIDHIKKIGCSAIYIGPLFESVGHGYETTDYKKLDSRLGTNEDLKKFVKKCHKNDIKVIFDGVFNHTGRDFFAFKDLQKNREQSAYKDWYCNVNFWGNNEYNDGFSYDNWGGYNLLVKLNQRNPAVRDYICDVIRFWVSEFDVDGIRLDAADVLDFDFMKSLRGLADSIKPDFWLMGEVIHGEYSRWVNESTLHSVTNYSLHKALYSGHNEHNYFEIAHTVKRNNDMGSNREGGLKLYNFTDNHDVARIISKLNNNADFYPVHILEYTLPGVPSIYYGSEYAIEGIKEKYSDDSIRPAIELEKMGDNSYSQFIAVLGETRKKVKTLSYGDYREVSLTNRQYMYTRNTDRYTCIVAVNNDDNKAMVYGGQIRDGEYTEALSKAKMTVSGGNVALEVPAHFGQIWVMNDEFEGLNEKVTFVEAMEESAVKAQPKPQPKPAPEPLPEPAPEPVPEPAAEAKLEPVAKPSAGSACAKYGLDIKYDSIDTEAIKNRTDYDNMSIEELQVAILEKMAHNGPVTDDMKRTVMDNVYPDSLKNWVRSFR